MGTAVGLVWDCWWASESAIVTPALIETPQAQGWCRAVGLADLLGSLCISTHEHLGLTTLSPGVGASLQTL